LTRARRFIAAAALSPVLLGGCTDWAGYDLDYFWGYIPALATMRNSVVLDPYEMPRLPPEHSVPIAGEFGNAPGPFTQAQLDSVAATLTNPFAGGGDPTVLARGEVLYASQCAICHGPTGAGNGPIIGAGKFPFSLPVSGGTAVGRSDGYIYAIIAAGRGLMPPYGEKLGHGDRWAVVEYVRELQRAGGAAPAAAPATTPAGGAAGATVPAAGAEATAAVGADTSPAVEP
jgi:mono/diheme cytochrome c family protein